MRHVVGNHQHFARAHRLLRDRSVRVTRGALRT
jgi:hypothetical protein